MGWLTKVIDFSSLSGNCKILFLLTTTGVLEHLPKSNFGFDNMRGVISERSWASSSWYDLSFSIYVKVWSISEILVTWRPQAPVGLNSLSSILYESPSVLIEDSWLVFKLVWLLRWPMLFDLIQISNLTLQLFSLLKSHSFVLLMFLIISNAQCPILEQTASAAWCPAQESDSLE